MNTIGKIQFDFSIHNEAFARNLYSKWDSFFANCVERILNEKLEMMNEELAIDMLELDLGSIFEDEFDKQFPIRFREKLEDAINKWREKTENKNIISKSSVLPSNSFLSLFCHFLLHGALPWSASGDNRDIHKLFLKVLQENAKEFKQFLQRYGHYTSLQQRLVYQLNDLELEKGVHLLAPEAEDFIIGYIYFLREKHKESLQPETTENDYRDVVWLVVYAYLLTQRSSYFDKKNFITQTIVQLAAKYNISYDNLLTQLTKELETYHKKHSISLELFRILEALHKDLSEKQLKESFVDAAKFYKTIYTSLKKQLDKQITETGREGLIHILANPSSCLMFLQQLNETEIIRLMPVVIPQEGNFVVDVAYTLERQKENGTLQGKAGGEFRLLKWQIIFPILLEKSETRFNRKEFVRSVIQQIIAHYNLDYSLILDFIIQQSELLQQLDRELKTIFLELYKEFKPESISNIKKETITPKETLDWILQNINLSKKWTLKQIRQVLKELSESVFQKRFLIHTSETERARLIQFIWPKEQEFIINYVKSLDQLYEHNQLEGKAGGNFIDVKWMFLFSVLSQMPEDNFNRKIFVYRVLQQVAVHYNLGYFELLLYFRQEKIDMALPFHLEQVLGELYQDEKKHWLEMMLKNETDKVKYDYLSCFPIIDKQFVKTYLQSLGMIEMKIEDRHEPNEKIGMENRKVISGFNFQPSIRKLRWHFVFSVLLEIRTKTFNKKYFIFHTLNKMAAHYNLAVYDLLVWFSVDFPVSPSSLYKEITMIIHELLLEQDKQNKSSLSKKKESDQNISSQQNIQNQLLQILTVRSKSEKQLLDQLAAHPEFLSYIKCCLPVMSDLKRFIRKEFNKSWDNQFILKLLIRLAENHSTLSCLEILSKIIRLLEVSLNFTSLQREKWDRQLKEQAKSDVLLFELLKEKEKNLDSTTQSPQNDEPIGSEAVDRNPIYINNAGLILLAPYLPRLFNMLGLTENEKFKDQESQIRAIYLIQYIVFGSTDFPEYEMVLNKLLTGFKTEKPIPRNIDLAEEEINVIDSMLQAVLQHWSKLKNTSIAGLREGFLQREGKLEKKEDCYELTIEERAYDILLDSIPWSFRSIKYKWMGKGIQVKWR